MLDATDTDAEVVDGPDVTVPALDGLFVVDLSTGISGPLAGMVFADNGARVVKVESPAGDWARGTRGFQMWNRGKEGIVLDLETSRDREALLRLLRRADVVIHNFCPAVSARLGLEDDVLALTNPRLIRCSITGFGRGAGFDDIEGYEDIVSAKLGRLIGLDEIRGAMPGRGDRPVYLLARSLSFAASQLAVQGSVAALLRRERTGRGTAVETSLVQAAAALSMRRSFARPHVEESGGAWSDQDLRYRGIKLTFLTVQCRDGKWLQMCARTDHHFRAWVQAVGLGEMLQEERYAGAPLGIQSAEALDELEVRLRSAMATRTQAEWMEMFVHEHDVPCDPFLTPEEFLNHAQMRDNGRVTDVEHPVLGLTTQLGPLALGTPSAIGAPAPKLGEHTMQILNEMVDSDDAAPRESATPASSLEDAPLAGVCVLELAYYIAGPLGAACLAELGARVIKVEPSAGDPWRPVGLESVHMLHGKESIVLDLKSSSGREVLRSLVEQTDVLITSFRPQVHAKLGFDYETAASLNPGIIHLYAGSYGSQGPWADRAAFHSTPNALCGAGILQAGEGNPPVDDDFPDPVAGITVGTVAAIALWARMQQGRGAQLETSMLASAGYAFSEYLVLGEGLPNARIPDSEQFGVGALRRLYRCGSGWLMLNVFTEREWRSLATALGHDEWLTDPRFRSADERAEHDPELSEVIGDALAHQTAESWESHLRERGVAAACADGRSFEQFLIDADRLKPATHPNFGDYYRLPDRIDIDGVRRQDLPACGIGEHTTAILAELGCDDLVVADVTRHQARE